MKLHSSICFLLLFMFAMSFAGCGTESPSSTKYWFSHYDSNFVAYDSESENDNIDVAGTYWNFTVAKDVDITLNVRVNIDYYSALSLSKNDLEVEGKTGSGIYTNSFDLSLRKGDKIKIHAYWTNSARTNDDGFEIQLLSITQNGQTYLLSEFDHSTTM